MLANNSLVFGIVPVSSTICHSNLSCEPGKIGLISDSDELFSNLGHTVVAH